MEYSLTSNHREIQMLASEGYSLLFFQLQEGAYPILYQGRFQLEERLQMEMDIFNNRHLSISSVTRSIKIATCLEEVDLIYLHQRELLQQQHHHQQQHYSLPSRGFLPMPVPVPVRLYLFIYLCFYLI